MPWGLGPAVPVVPAQARWLPALDKHPGRRPLHNFEKPVYWILAFNAEIQKLKERLNLNFWKRINNERLENTWTWAIIAIKWEWSWTAQDVNLNGPIKHQQEQIKHLIRLRLEKQVSISNLKSKHTKSANRQTQVINNFS